MANCPRCGTADFYPSFSGKGECLEFRCDLFSKEHFEKTFKMPATKTDMAEEVTRLGIGSPQDPTTAKFSVPTPSPWHILDSTNTAKYFDQSRSVDATEEKGVPYTPDEYSGSLLDDIETSETTLREVTLAIGCLLSAMSGKVIHPIACKSFATKLIENYGLRVVTYFQSTRVGSEALNITAFGAERILVVERLDNTGLLAISIQ